MNDFDAGFVVGLLVGEGHFGGDGRQPHVTLRMHTRHEHIFQWLKRQFPDSKLYGPYSHGGRDYYQWMARGMFLREELIPLLDEHLTDELDEWAFTRFRDMKARYRIDDDRWAHAERVSATTRAGSSLRAAIRKR